MNADTKSRIQSICRLARDLGWQPDAERLAAVQSAVRAARGDVSEPASAALGVLSVVGVELSPDADRVEEVSAVCDEANEIIADREWLANAARALS
jgi:hypothetical protein